MDYQLEKCMRIISDLVSHCHWAGAQAFTMTMHHSDDDSASHICITCELPDISDAWLEEMRLALSAHRQREVEQSYWELSGEAEMSDELTLVGMMLDTTTVTYDGSTLTIEALRKD